MLRRLRENGPVVLVPLAWTFVTAAHLDLVSRHTLLVGHVVIDVILAAFAVLSWSDMRSGVLRVWWLVIAVGLGVNLVGTAGLLADPVNQTYLAITVYGWMILPALALAHTSRHVEEAPWVYLAGALLSVLGLLVYAGAVPVPGVAATVAGLTLVNVGQTAGIVNAVYQY